MRKSFGFVPARMLVPACAAAAIALGGCGVEEQDDASAFREAIPAEGSVRVDGPDSATSTHTGTASLSRGTLAAGPGGDPAYWYTFTRDVRDGVNLVTAGVLVSVWFVVHLEPTELEVDRAVWGPFEGDALDPVRWRLSVERVGEHHYAYTLEGQPKAGGAKAPYLTVLEGDGYSRRSELHGDGAFSIDLDAARALDPSRHEGDSGTVVVTHELPPDIGRRQNALPRTISASLRPAGGDALDIVSTAHEDNTGELLVTAKADLEGSETAVREDISVTSRWAATGAGRADVGISGGDAATGATAVECWGSDFSRVYYTDSIALAPTEGTERDCAYGSP